MRGCLAARAACTGSWIPPDGWPGVAGDSPSIGVLAVLTEAMAEVTRGAPDRRVSGAVGHDSLPCGSLAMLVAQPSPVSAALAARTGTLITCAGRWPAAS